MTEYIEREAVLKLLGKKAREPYYQHEGEDYYIGMADAMQEVRIFPTAEVGEVRHAYLESTGYDEAYCEWGNCSNCGGDNYIEAKFCNWCGAKLDREVNHEG